MSEISPYGLRPRARFGAALSLLLQDGENTGRGLPERARSKQPEVSNSMVVAFRNVLGPTVNELLQRALNLYTTTQLLSLYQNLTIRSPIQVIRRWAIGGLLTYRPAYRRKCSLPSKD